MLLIPAANVFRTRVARTLRPSTSIMETPAVRDCIGTAAPEKASDWHERASILRKIMVPDDQPVSFQKQDENVHGTGRGIELRIGHAHYRKGDDGKIIRGRPRQEHKLPPPLGKRPIQCKLNW